MIGLFQFLSLKFIHKTLCQPQVYGTRHLPKGAMLRDWTQNHAVRKPQTSYPPSCTKSITNHYFCFLLFQIVKEARRRKVISQTGTQVLSLFCSLPPPLSSPSPFTSFGISLLPTPCLLFHLPSPPTNVLSLATPTPTPCKCLLPLPPPSLPSFPLLFCSPFSHLFALFPPTSPSLVPLSPLLLIGIIPRPFHGFFFCTLPFISG